MGLQAWIRRQPLTAFLVGSVGLGWALTILSAQLPTSSVLLPLVAIPVSYVPAILAVIVLRIGGTPDERRALRRRLTTFRVGWIWYAIALVGLPMVHIAGVALATLFGGTMVVHPALLALLPLFIVTNLGEEIGWRGYALPKLQDRLSPLAASIVLGLVWGAFHWVALLGNRDAPLAYVIVSTFHLTAMSVILGFVFNSARQSLPVVVLVHAMYDTVSIGVVPLIDTGVPLLAFALSAVVAWVVVVALVVAKGSSFGLGRPQPTAGISVSG
jgi:membrane protease YdiL (CAAX protease family)